MKQKLNKLNLLLAALIETILSAAIVLLLYILYLPFGLAKGLFSRQLITDFMKDVLYFVKGFREGIFKRKKE